MAFLYGLPYPADLGSAAHQVWNEDWLADGSAVQVQHDRYSAALCGGGFRRPRHASKPQKQMCAQHQTRAFTAPGHADILRHIEHVHTGAASRGKAMVRAARHNSGSGRCQCRTRQADHSHSAPQAHGLKHACMTALPIAILLNCTSNPESLNEFCCTGGVRCVPWAVSLIALL